MGELKLARLDKKVGARGLHGLLNGKIVLQAERQRHKDRKGLAGYLQCTVLFFRQKDIKAERIS